MTRFEGYCQSFASPGARGKELNRATASRILAKFLSHLDGRFYTCFAVESQHIRLARDWIGQLNTSLKSLDALHLAVASLEGLSLVTADRDLADSAKILGIDFMHIEAGE